MNRFAFRTIRLGATLALAIAAAPVHAQTEPTIAQDAAQRVTGVLINSNQAAGGGGGATPELLSRALAAEYDTPIFSTLFRAQRSTQEELLGATLQPLRPVQRAQIDIPEGQGLIVDGVNPNSAADQIGLRAYDILLTLSDKPLAKPEDFNEVLKTSGTGKALTLVFLRKGKRETVELQPLSVITFGPVAKVERSYMIGVAVGPLDEVLTAQYDGKLEGLVVNDVIAGKPAEKAGIKVGDILVRIDEQPLTTTEQLTEKIKGSEGKPVLIHFRRRDKIDSVQLTPVPREDSPPALTQTLRVYGVGAEARPELLIQQLGSATLEARAIERLRQAKDHDPEPRVAAIEKEIEGLKRQLAEIQELIKAQAKK